MVRAVSRRFDEYLHQLDEGTLKRLMRGANGMGEGGRSEMIRWLEKALDDPARLQMAIKSLRVSEQSILAILKELGGICDDTVLQTAAFGAGVHFPGAPQPKGRAAPVRLDAREVFNETLQHLVKTGLALNMNDHYTLTRLQRYEYSGQTNLIFSDDRILAQVGRPAWAPPPLPSSRNPAPATTGVRLPHLVTMQIVSLLQALERANGLGLTQTGEVRAVDLRKVAKSLNWPDGGLRDEMFTFPRALGSLVKALHHAGVLQPAGESNQLVVGDKGIAFTQLPIEAQVRALLIGLVQSNRVEFNEERRGGYNPYPSARAGLFYLLTSLPAEERGPFYDVDDLDQVLFDRIGSFFSISENAYRRYYTSYQNRYRDSSGRDPLPARRKEWQKEDRPWLVQSLCSWLYFLGVVELAVEEEQVVAFRLTDLGRAALHPELEIQAHSAPKLDQGPAWVIQPNFDVIAYLDRLSTLQLAFLERHADRRSAQEHLAEYHLTRDSVYRGLEGGTRFEDLLDELQRGAERELPQNVITEIREWAAQRERITLWRRAALAEFPSEAARELAVRAGLSGTPVADRFMLMTSGPNRPLSRIFKHTINYDQTAQRNLLIGEDGVVTYNHPNLDLLLQARLALWTEPYGEEARIFTRESVRSAVMSGRSLASLLKLIDDRQYKILPAMVRIMLRAWGGENFSTAVEPVVILRAGSAELSYALQQSEMLRPYLISTVTPGIFLVKPDQVKDLQAALNRMGLMENDLK